MNKLRKLLLDHWLAKIVSLALAVTLWAVIKTSLGTTTLPSRVQFETEHRPQIEFGTKR